MGNLHLLEVNAKFPSLEKCFQGLITSLMPIIFVRAVHYKQVVTKKSLASKYSYL